MDALLRNRPVLLIVLGLGLGACSPAKRELVGVSTGGAEEDRAKDKGANNPPLAGLPSEFRTTWTKTSSRVASEHAQLEADVFADSSECAGALRGKPLPGACKFVEELFRRDAGVGIYLLQQGDAGARFAVADPRGRTIADDGIDGGAAALDACARCHAEAPRAGIFPVPR